MKTFKKMMALVIAMVMVLGMAIPAMAASITITRDNSYDGTGDGNTYKYYKVFSASYESNTSTGGGSTAGAPGDVTASAEHASYTASAAVAAKLGQWVAAAAEDDPATTDVDESKAHWVRATGNNWFDLTPIAGSNPQTYSVAWINSSETSETAQAAAKWLMDNAVYEGSGTALTYTEGTGWTSGTIDPGYYLVEGATGKNLVAATTDVTIKEKNTYPGDDKKQKDADDGEDFGDDDVNVAVGDVINYTVTVTIPATAKVGDAILVWDKASTGLSYVANSVTNTTVTGITVTDPAAADIDSSWDWSKLIKITSADALGKSIVFSFNMTVTSDAITDTDKKNESGLKYGHDDGENPIPWKYESNPDEVLYKTYFAGIHKIDGDTKEDLSGVKFALKEDGVAFNVTLTDGVYIPGGSSNEVVTDNDGLIRIRGLDSTEKTYTLTETENPHPDYNMLASDVTLTLNLDTVTKVTYTPAETYDAEASYYTKDGDNYVAATVEEADFVAGQYYTKSESTSTFGSATEDTWDLVENKKGSVLPSTGGIGTTIFYVIGAILVLGAGILLVTRRRMNVR